MSIEQQTIADLIKLLDEMPNAPEVLQPCNTQQNANYTKSRRLLFNLAPYSNK
ncbi:hypothetical protein [Pseudoalteromonas sp. NBT06-2]|uniref:hypothetical protein n=1 Tax=Pseudoalteromonas sp. NBT06-2 TaxID=2025950 RepID=UPI0014831B66|nr:hypothetical protein [Pseudoalteromonas sp. NBT06-2]